MARIISSGLLKSDDPIFSGGVQTFTVRRPKPPPKDIPKDEENHKAGEKNDDR